MHPAGVGVETLIDEELTPGGGAVDVKALVAAHLFLGSKEEGGVRIDQQQGVVIDSVGGGDGDAVRPCGLDERARARRGLRLRAVIIELFEI